MKTIAAIQADFERSFFDLPSRLNEEIAGETVLRRTLKRLLASRRIARVHLIVERSQESAAQQAAAGLDVAVETHNGGRPPWQGYVSAARKWSMDGWRGGLAGTNVFDESAYPHVLDALARRESADAVVDVPPAACLIDPALTDTIIDHFEKVRDDVRLAFTQSAPGLTAAIYHPQVLAELAQAAHPPGRAMAYQPDNPRHDPIMQPCHYPADATIAHASGRCVADTATGVARLGALLRECAGESLPQGPDALTVSRWLLANRHRLWSELPDEVEVELTTDDPLAASTLRPRGNAAGQRGPMTKEVFERLCGELAQRDDARLVLGGFGDPLRHPDWPAFVQIARQAGVFAIAVRTPAVDLDEQAARALLDAGVDVLNVLLDAHSAEGYRRVHGADHYDRVVANVDRFYRLQQETARPRPLVVCEMVKTHETLDDLEPFYDHWTRKTGSAVIAGPSHYAGQWPDRSVMQMSPPTRFPCGRLFRRAMILADGTVSLCDQDFRGQHAIGSLMQSSLRDLWTSAALQSIRDTHLAGNYTPLPLCRACEEWHRP